MLHVTRIMINMFHIEDIDFMGYHMERKDATFHHLIIPKRNCGTKSVENGAVLNRFTSHTYLHLIEYKDYEIFYLITKEMMKENYLKRIDEDCLKRINTLLKYFEKENSSSRNFDGEPLIKEEYTKRLYNSH